MAAGKRFLVVVEWVVDEPTTDVVVAQWVSSALRATPVRGAFTASVVPVAERALSYAEVVAVQQAPAPDRRLN